MNIYLEFILGILIFITAIGIASAKNLFALMILLSLFSGLMTTMYALLGAPDVAFTEAVVGTSISTLFFMALVRKVKIVHINSRNLSQKIGALIISLLLGGLLLYGVYAEPAFGASQSPAFDNVATEYLQHAYEKTATPNIVTAILADYRGFDTLIETAVVLTAALACLLVLYRKDDDETV